MTSDWIRAYDRKHAGHVVVVRPDRSRFCQTCAAERVAERRHNVRVLTLLGSSAKEIAIRLGVTSRTVTRDRAWLREQAGKRRAA